MILKIRIFVNAHTITVFEIQACSNTGQIIYSSDKISINLYPDDIITPVLETKRSIETKKSNVSFLLNSTVDKLSISRPEIAIPNKSISLYLRFSLTKSFER